MSGTASRHKDLSGQEIRKRVDHYFNNCYDFSDCVIPYDEEFISGKLIHLLNIKKCSLIFTIERPVSASRDVTSKVTEKSLLKNVFRFCELSQKEFYLCLGHYIIFSNEGNQESSINCEFLRKTNCN